MKQFHILWAYLACVTTGYLLLGSPSDPDQLFTKTQELGTFIFFLAWVIAVTSWGNSLSCLLKIKETGVLGIFSLGTAFVSMVGFAFGVMGWIRFEWSVLGQLVLALGPLVACIHPPFELTRHPFFKSRLNQLGILGISFLIYSYLTNASYFHGYSDPSIYHLTAPRLWLNAGRISFRPEWPIAYQATWWEMSYLWLQWLTGASPGLGLFEGQYLAQYHHVVFGLGGVIIALYYTLSKSADYGPWLLLTIPLVLIGGGLTDMLPVAKNDWGILFWILAGISFACDTEGSQTMKKGLAGFFWGLALSGKINSAPAILSFIFLGTVMGIKMMKPSLILGLAASSTPIFVRNLSATGNPFYPFFLQWTDRNLIPPVFARELILAPMRLHFSPEFILAKIKWFQSDHPFNLAALFMPLLALLSKDKIFRTLALTSFASSLWIFIVEMRFPFARWAGLSVILPGPLLATFVIHKFQIHAKGAPQEMKLLPLRAGSTIKATIYAAVLLAVLSQTASLRTLKFWDQPSPTWLIRNPRIALAGDAKTWLRLNAEYPIQANLNGNVPIVTTGESQSYYLSKFPVTSILENAEVNRLIDPLVTIEELSQALSSKGFRYILDTRHPEQGAWSFQSLILSDVVFKFPEAIAYQGKNSRVIDLKVIQESEIKACTTRT